MSEMRHRRPAGPSSSGPASAVFGSLKKFDIYSKVHDDYTVKTNSGGLITLASWAVMILLFLSELRTYMTVEVVDHVVVDTTMNQRLPISVNITFPHIRCDDVSVDTVDSVGENQVDIHGSLRKIPLDYEGHEAKVRDHVARAGECDSCFEAESDSRKCCNSCGELREAYMEKGLSYFEVLATAPQCQETIGCQIFGDVLVNKVGGNVHVALGRSMVKDGKHVHEFNLKDVSDGFNTSHIIHTLRFGSLVPGVDAPLEGTSKVVHSGAEMFHYYIKLVPTMFVPHRDPSRPVYTNQYAVTETSRNVLVSKGQLTGLPGVFLVYDFNPFMVQKVEKAVPLSHFLTSVAAIIGGVFTVSGLVDSLLYSGMKRLTAIRGGGAQVGPKFQ